MLAKICLALSLIASATLARAEDNGHTNALYVSPLSMMIYSGLTGNAVIAAAYEHRLTPSGYSLFVPAHAAYRETTDELRYTIGAGLGLRKYFGGPFSGSYLTAQSDLTRYQDYDDEYTPMTTDQNGNWIGGQYSRVRRERFLSVTQVAYGYKWDWRQFTLDLNVGGAFYAQEDEKYTSVIGGVNVGFPFSAKNFGFR